MHLESPEAACVLPVSGTAAFDFIQSPQIFRIVRLHGYGPANMLQRRHLIAETIVGQRAEVVPPCIPLGRITQSIERLLLPSKTNVIIGGLLVIVAAVSFRIAALL